MIADRHLEKAGVKRIYDFFKTDKEVADARIELEEASRDELKEYAQARKEAWFR